MIRQATPTNGRPVADVDSDASGAANTVFVFPSEADADSAKAAIPKASCIDLPFFLDMLPESRAESLDGRLVRLVLPGNAGPRLRNLTRRASEMARALTSETRVICWEAWEEGTRIGFPDHIGPPLVHLESLPDADLEPDRAGASKPFTLGLIDSTAFFSERYELQWLVKGAVVAGESLVIGGPSKSLKTSLLIDLFISMGTATPFLDRFPVPKPLRVGLISGESGRRVIQANAREVLRGRDLSPADAGGVFWGFTLPRLANGEHLAVLRQTIRLEGLEAIGIDPLYLSLLAGAGGIDASNMFEMGPILNDVAALCIDEGCTPILCHHSVKRRDNPFDPMELEDLAYAGVGQFMRQWMLISRRERFDAESGLHKLHFRYGGSAGHCGELHVDIETGRVDEDFNGRMWHVTTRTPTEGREVAQDEAKRLQEAKELAKDQEKAEKAERTRAANAGKVVEAIRWLAGRGEAETLTQIAAKAALSYSAARVAVTQAITEGRVEPYKAEVSNGTSVRRVDAYRMVGVSGRVIG